LRIFQGELNFVSLETTRNRRKKRPVGRPKIHKDNAAKRRAYRQRLKRSVHFRSDTDVWETPQAFFDTLHAEFGFTLDVCAPNRVIISVPLVDNELDRSYLGRLEAPPRPHSGG
jgi:hypothetical protein